MKIALYFLKGWLYNCGIQEGSIVISIAGRDKGSYFIVVKVDENYAYLVDGDIRKVENPKKKKLKHIEITKLFDEEMASRILKNNKITNHDIKRSLREALRK